LLPRRPRPTLFRYTTLFRSIQGVPELALQIEQGQGAGEQGFAVQTAAVVQREAAWRPRLSQEQGLRFQDVLKDARGLAGLPGQRSEEHTSELQSRENLVCRL